MHQRAQVLELHQEKTQPSLECCKSREHQANEGSPRDKEDHETALKEEKSQALREVENFQWSSFFLLS